MPPPIYFWPLALACFGAGLLAGAIAARRLLRREHLRAIRAEGRARQAERLAEQGAMTGGLAHEIKNPLSTIGLNAQLLAEGIADLPASDEQAKARLLNRVGALRRETERLRGILQDFLDYAGQVRLDRRPTDVNVLCSELVDFLLPEAGRSGVRLRLEAAPGELVVPVDVRLIKQALLNLLLNAIQAVASVGERPGADGMPRGEVILRTDLYRQPERAKGGRGRGGGGGSPAASGWVRVHVIDSGPGIPAENLSKIFQPYFTTKGGGTGLGLPTSRRFIEEHGGTLTVTSAPGLGTDFCVSLPETVDTP